MHMKVVISPASIPKKYNGSYADIFVVAISGESRQAYNGSRFDRIRKRMTSAMAAIPRVLPGNGEGELVKAVLLTVNDDKR